MNTNNTFLLSFFRLTFFASIFVIGNGQDLSSFPCVTKLVPCQAMLMAPSEPPPESCCRPLNQLLASPNDTKCLCSILNNPIMMKSFNVTKNDAFKLAKACGSKSGDSLCQAAAPSPGSAPSPPANSSSPSNGSAVAPSAKKSMASGLSSCCVVSLVIMIISVVLLLSVF